MQDQISRKDVSAAVVNVIQGWHFDLQITENTDFEIDIPIDKKTKGLYYYAIRIRLEKMGYEFANFKPEDCEEARTIADIVNAVWDDLNPRSRNVM